MKAWMNKLGGVLLASLLTVMLNGKAYAEEKPEGAGIEASTPAAADSGLDNAVVSSGDTGMSFVDVGAGSDVLSAGSGDTVTRSVDVGAGASDAGGGSIDDGMGSGDTASDSAVYNTGAADTDVEIAGDITDSFGAGTGSADVDFDDPAAEGKLTDGIQLQNRYAEDPVNPENPVTPSDDAANGILETLTLTVEPQKLTKGLQDKTNVSAMAMLGSSAPTVGADENRNTKNNDGEYDGENNGGKGTDDQQTIRFDHDEENKRYVLVNYSETTSRLSVDDDHIIMAAGLNHVGSISGSGTVAFVGTGILLVDSLEGNPEFLTFTDMYDEGSVAVFVKQDNDQYLLVNGSVPGILDEEYTITEDVTLVMPDQTKLLLCGTGRATLRDSEGNETVAYYHGSDANYSPLNSVSSMDAIETTGKLTIAQQAALIVKQGASIVLQNLTSLGGTETFDGIRYPEFIVNTGGKLIVDDGGSVNGGGFVEIGPEEATLSGKGSISASRITVKDTRAINGSEVQLSSREIRLQTISSEETTLGNLKIQDSTVFIDIAKPHITGLDSTGNSTLVLPDASTLDISRVDGVLHLSQKKYYNKGSGSTNSNKTFYNDDNAQIITGSITGTGTIYFDSGIYKIVAGTTVTDDITFSADSENSEEYGGLVYDYTGVTATSQNPRLVQPTKVKRADENSGKIPVIAAELHEKNSSTGVKTITVHDLVIRVQDTENGVEQEVQFPVTSLTAVKNGENWTLQLQDIKTAVNNTDNGFGVVFEVLHKEKEGDIVNLRTDFYTLSTLPDNLAADDICLVRVSYVKNAETVAPAANATKTGTTYTGSGILGGSNAGSVTIGQGTASNSTGGDNNNSNSNSGNNGGDNNSSNGTGNNSGNNNSSNDTGGDNSGSNTGNNINGNAMNTTNDPEPAPLAVYVDEDPAASPLIWVEEASGVGEKTTDTADTHNSEETKAEVETTYVLLALEGEKTLEDLGGKAAVSMSYTPPAEYKGKTLYVVFRDENNKLIAFRATYSDNTHLLHFITKRLGEFMVVGFDFDSAEFEEFSPEFYKALAQLKGLENLVYAEYSPV